jgi:hypothetical protein
MRVGTARWAVSETQRSAGVSELRGDCDGPALRWPSWTSQRDVPTFKSGLDPHSALESLHPTENLVRDGFYGGFRVGIEAYGGLGVILQIKTKLVQTPAETNFLADSGFYFGP